MRNYESPSLLVEFTELENEDNSVTWKSFMDAFESSNIDEIEQLEEGQEHRYGSVHIYTTVEQLNFGIVSLFKHKYNI